MYINFNFLGQNYYIKEILIYFYWFYFLLIKNIIFNLRLIIIYNFSV